jgi:hypothetical protein
MSPVFFQLQLSCLPCRVRGGRWRGTIKPVLGMPRNAISTAPISVERTGDDKLRASFSEIFSLGRCRVSSSAGMRYSFSKDMPAIAPQIFLDHRTPVRAAVEREYMHW